MFEKQTRPYWRYINVLLVCCNALLFVFFLGSWLRKSYVASVQIRDDAKDLGMNHYCTKGPFTIFVDKNFPRRHKFCIIDYAKSLIFDGGDVDEKIYDSETTEAEVLLGPDFSFGCCYSVVNVNGSPRPKMDEYMLTIKDTAFRDLNADGTFDTRNVVSRNLNADGTFDARNVVSADRNRDVYQIWYEGQWRDVDPKGKWSVYERQLPGIGVVRFDRKTVRWTPAPATNHGGDEAPQVKKEK